MGPMLVDVLKFGPNYLTLLTNFLLIKLNSAENQSLLQAASKVGKFGDLETII